MADYIGGVDFRDGTGPSALPPNDVLRAFRDAEDFALLGRGAELWSRLTGGSDDHSRDHHHSGGRSGTARTGRGWGRGGSGGGANGRRRRVVHVESATTGKFFKVKDCSKSDGVVESLEEGEQERYASSRAVYNAAAQYVHYYDDAVRRKTRVHDVTKFCDIGQQCILQFFSPPFRTIVLPIKPLHPLSNNLHN